jgi:cysteine-rich repeat protein
MNLTDGTCVYCSNYLSKCQTCADTLNCTLCQPYYGSLNGVCTLCSMLIPGCVLCSSDTVCTSCNPYYTLTGANCTKCSELIVGCELCSSTAVCVGCYAGRFLQSGSCPQCYLGVPGCHLCTSTSVCTLCYDEATLSADNSTCVCAPGFALASNLCIKQGCASAYHFESGPVCLACNKANHMEYNGVYCECSLGYLASGDTCLLVCGDGRVITEDCDDGNILSGDGCSPNCTVEADYSCSGGSLYHRSTCAYSSPISVELVEIKRAVGSNSATITLSLAPALTPLVFMNFTQHVLLQIGNSSLAYTCNYVDSGVLTISVNFN